jgi:hypothetical protein
MGLVEAAGEIGPRFGSWVRDDPPCPFVSPFPPLASLQATPPYSPLFPSPILQATLKNEEFVASRISAVEGAVQAKQAYLRELNQTVAQYEAFSAQVLAFLHRPCTLFPLCNLLNRLSPPIFRNPAPHAMCKPNKPARAQPNCRSV